MPLIIHALEISLTFLSHPSDRASTLKCPVTSSSLLNPPCGLRWVPCLPPVTCTRRMGSGNSTGYTTRNRDATTNGWKTAMKTGNANTCRVRPPRRLFCWPGTRPLSLSGRSCSSPSPALAFTIRNNRLGSSRYGAEVVGAKRVVVTASLVCVFVLVRPRKRRCRFIVGRCGYIS